MATIPLTLETPQGTMHLCPCCEEEYVSSPTMVCAPCDRYLSEIEAREMARFEQDRQEEAIGRESYVSEF